MFSSRLFLPISINLSNWNFFVAKLSIWNICSTVKDSKDIFPHGICSLRAGLTTCTTSGSGPVLMCIEIFKLRSCFFRKISLFSSFSNFSQIKLEIEFGCWSAFFNSFSDLLLRHILSLCSLRWAFRLSFRFIRWILYSL